MFPRRRAFLLTKETTMNHYDEPKKPNQVPPGDLSDAIGTHEEVPYDDVGEEEGYESDDDED